MGGDKAGNDLSRLVFVWFPSCRLSGVPFTGEIQLPPNSFL